MMKVFLEMLYGWEEERWKRVRVLEGKEKDEREKTRKLPGIGRLLIYRTIEAEEEDYLRCTIGQDIVFISPFAFFRDTRIQAKRFRYDRMSILKFLNLVKRGLCWHREVGSRLLIDAFLNFGMLTEEVDSPAESLCGR